MLYIMHGKLKDNHIQYQRDENKEKKTVIYINMWNRII